MRTLAPFFCALTWVGTLAAQARYELPPKPVVDAVLAPPTPQVTVNPTGTHLLLVHGEGHPTIAALARPMLALAGRRIDPGTYGPQRGSRGVGMTLVAIADGKQNEIPLPATADVSNVSFAAHGKSFAFVNTTDEGLELWVADVATARAKRIEGVRLCATLAAPLRWHADQQRLLCLTVANPGPAPTRPAAPNGPKVEEAKGKKSPVRTYQDLLASEHDVDLFEHFMTSQIVDVDPSSGAVVPIHEPRLWVACDASPDGKHLLVTRLVKPYSYRVAAAGFPKEVAVLDATGKFVRVVANQPGEEGVPIEGVPTGPRQIRWLPNEAAQLGWVEALDGGDPKAKAERRDRVVRASLDGEPGQTLFETRFRLQGMQTVGGKDGGLLWTEVDRDRKWRTTHAWLAGANGDQPFVFHEGSTQDAYTDPGRPVTRVSASGDPVVLTHGSSFYLDGDGASSAGDRPFLDRFDWSTRKKERLFECSPGRYERVVRVLDPEASTLLVTSESKTDPANWYVLDRATQTRRPLTAFGDPMAALTKGITKERIEYTRKDGVKLTATLYLPPGHEAGKRWPVFVWAYPREYADAGTAGQVRGSEHRYTRLAASSPLLLLLAGYAVLDDASMPVVGPPETANDTFVTQIVASAQAAIDVLVERGVADRERFAVGGHSYGAFMTANLLAHCNLFRCGVARSGAYNRTLTPFGFQSERRTFWEAPQIYHALSPFSYADKIDEPLLLIHGEADDNPGTFPVQSQRLFQAIAGHGGKARLVMLPHEAHGYRAKESLLHTLAETIRWLDTHLAKH